MTRQNEIDNKVHILISVDKTFQSCLILFRIHVRKGLYCYMNLKSSFDKYKKAEYFFRCTQHFSYKTIMRQVRNNDLYGRNKRYYSVNHG